MKNKIKYFLVYYKVKANFAWDLPNPAIIMAESAERAKMIVEGETAIAEAHSAQEIDFDRIGLIIKE